MSERKTLSEWEGERKKARAKFYYEQGAFYGHVRSLFGKHPLNMQRSIDIKMFKMCGYNEEDIEVLQRFAGLVASHVLEGLVIREKKSD